MPRSFNTTGPCDPRRRYLLSPERRLLDLLPFVEQDLYFVVHAARRTGRTTAGASTCAAVDVAGCQPFEGGSL